MNIEEIAEWVLNDDNKNGPIDLDEYGMANLIMRFLKEKSGNLGETRNAVLGEVREEIETFIKNHRKINWESAFEKEEYCIGENKVREFITVLIGKHFA